jgi:hypothetical protein
MLSRRRMSQDATFRCGLSNTSKSRQTSLLCRRQVSDVVSGCQIQCAGLEDDAQCMSAPYGLPRIRIHRLPSAETGGGVRHSKLLYPASVFRVNYSLGFQQRKCVVERRSWHERYGADSCRQTWPIWNTIPDHPVANREAFLTWFEIFFQPHHPSAIG